MLKLLVILSWPAIYVFKSFRKKRDSPSACSGFQISQFIMLICAWLHKSALWFLSWLIIVIIIIIIIVIIIVIVIIIIIWTLPVPTNYTCIMGRYAVVWKSPSRGLLSREMGEWATVSIAKKKKQSFKTFHNW
jgi:hypothetical protein